MKKSGLILTILLSWGVCSGQQADQISVYANQPGAKVQSTMWGLFFEDINFAADGGVYAELVKNRSFEFDDPMMGWKMLNNGNGRLFIYKNEKTENPHYIRLETHHEGAGFGIMNEGFRGMGVKQDATYNLSLQARNIKGTNNRLTVSIIDSLDHVLGEASLKIAGAEWTPYKAAITVSSGTAKAKLAVISHAVGTVDLDMISLFPADTWRGRPNGLRKDLVQLLADMKPGFLRFPGGCIVEGRTLSNRYQWKNTLGEPANRKLIINRWNTEFKHRLTPDYFQSFGLGYFEYFQLAEDIGAEPLPIMNCGMACQYNTSELVPLDDIGPYIQDVLDLIEFANGPVTSRWGNIRAEMGHPEPFNLNMVGIGNEQWGPQYIERYQQFANVIKEKYPDMVLVSGAGPAPDGELFDFGWENLRKLNADMVDEHYYRNPEWFLDNASRYDSYDRNGPKVFAGEYAAHSKQDGSSLNHNDWKSALVEAAFMTGLERNADIVHMASYAPLFAHVGGWQWTPDLIWFDNLSAFGTPNYYVQKLFSTNRGTHRLPVSPKTSSSSGKERFYVSAVLDSGNREIIIKLVNFSDRALEKEIVVEGFDRLDPTAKMIILQHNELKAVNSIEFPEKISPVETVINSKKNPFPVSLGPNSFSVIKVKLQAEGK